MLKFNLPWGGPPIPRLIARAFGIEEWPWVASARRRAAEEAAAERVAAEETTAGRITAEEMGRWRFDQWRQVQQIRDKLQLEWETLSPEDKAKIVSQREAAAAERRLRERTWTVRMSRRGPSSTRVHMVGPIIMPMSSLGMMEYKTKSVVAVDREEARQKAHEYGWHIESVY